MPGGDVVNLGSAMRAQHLDNGPRYGVNGYAGPWPSGPVFAWFVYAPDAFAYAEVLGLHVWDLVAGRRLEHLGEAVQ